MEKITTLIIPNSFIGVPKMTGLEMRSLERRRRHRAWSKGRIGIDTLGAGTWAAAVFCVLAVLIAAWLLLAPHALAQDDGPEPLRAVVGPYEIEMLTVQSTVSVGATLIVASVIDSITREPVPDARVIFRVKHEDDKKEGWASAHNTPRSPQLYEAQLNLDAPGIWTLKVEVTSALGKATMEGEPLEVAEIRQFTSGSIVFAGAFLVLILGVLYVWWSIQQTRRRRESAAAVTGEGPDDAGPKPGAPDP